MTPSMVRYNLKPNSQLMLLATYVEPCFSFSSAALAAAFSFSRFLHPNGGHNAEFLLTNATHNVKHGQHSLELQTYFFK